MSDENPKPARPCERGEGAAHNPLGPLRTGLNFAQLRALAKAVGQTLSCSMCGYRYPDDATTSKHECQQRLFKYELVKVEPMKVPTGPIFYLDFKYPEK